MIPTLTAADLKAWREAHRLSQDELGEALGITREWVGKLERGEREISAKILLRFQALKREHELSSENLKKGEQQSADDLLGAAPMGVVALRRDEPIDHEYSALMQKFEHALEDIRARGLLLETAHISDATAACRTLFARYMDAGKSRDRVGWLNLEVQRLVDSAPFPKKFP